MNASLEWLSRLNLEQREAVTHGEAGESCDRAAPGAPLLIIAGAGTGKTATLAHRVVWLVSQGVDPQRILLLTFSRRAAVEMARRAQRLLARRAAEGAVGGVGPVVESAVGSVPGSMGGDGDRVALAGARLEWAGTFHAIGARLLREHAEAVGLDPDFGILDRGDAADLMDLVRQDGNLRLVMKDWPIFGDASVTAAQAALGAASFGRYADAVEALITARGLKTDDDVMAALAAAGIDEAKLTKAVNDGIDKINGLLDRNYRQADGFGFDGTPSYVIETAVFRGALDADALRTMIGDARKAKAKAKADAPI